MNSYGLFFATKIITEPTITPVSLADQKLHMRALSQSFTDNLTQAASISANKHDQTDGDVTGTGVDISGTEAIFQIDFKKIASVGFDASILLQESADNVTYNAFQTIAIDETTATSITEYSYTGVKQYIRVVLDWTAGAGGSIGLSGVILKRAYQVSEDTLIESYLATATKYIEDYTGHSFITQTREIVYGGLPDDFQLLLYQSPVQSVTSVKYYDSDNTESTLAAASYYVDTYSVPGRIILNDGYSWPSNLRRGNSVIIRYISGYGDAVGDVPEVFKQAIRLLTSHYYDNREIIGRQYYDIPMSIKPLLWQKRSNIL